MSEIRREQGVWEVPNHPILLGSLPAEIQIEFIQRHKESFPEIWEIFTLEQILETLYTMDLRELISTDGPRC